MTALARFRTRHFHRLERDDILVIMSDRLLTPSEVLDRVQAAVSSFRLKET